MENKKRYFYTWLPFYSCTLHSNAIVHTLEHPGVKAPGTANNTTFFPSQSSLMFILLAGVFSYKSTFGMRSPIYRKQRKVNVKDGSATRKLVYTIPNISSGTLIGIFYTRNVLLIVWNKELVYLETECEHRRNTYVNGAERTSFSGFYDNQRLRGLLHIRGTISYIRLYIK